MVRKIVYGWVSQSFDDQGHCFRQEFLASDEGQYEDEDGEELEDERDFYYPFNMIQPNYNYNPPI